MIAASPPRPVPRFAVLLIALAGIAMFAVLLMCVIRSDPNVVFLSPDGPAQWIKPPTDSALVMQSPGRFTALFRTEFSVEAQRAPITLHAAALRNLTVVLDGATVYAQPDNSQAWKRERIIRLPADLELGQHRLLCIVTNDNGPPALRLSANAPGLFSGPDWTYSEDGVTWVSAWPVSRVEPTWISSTFPAPRDQFFDIMSLLTIACLAGGAGVWAAGRRPAWARALTPARTRILVQLALLVLGVHTAFLANPFNGADAPDHYQYIHWFTEHAALPDVADGAQLFQAPLFYFVAALLHRVLGLGLDHETVDQAVRLLPVLCGVGLVEVTYRMLRRAFPDRAQLQIVGLLIGGFVPMLIYKTQFVGNQAAVALLNAATVLLVLAWFDAGRPPAGAGRFALAGAAWGLACLAKVSALVLAPVILLAMSFWIYATRPAVRAACVRLGAFAAAFLLTCAWFYIANYLRYGKPVIGGWSPEVGYVWWQFPGYRSPDQYLSFGRVFSHPVSAQFFSFWDAMYAGLWFDTELGGVVNRVNHPKWDYRFAVSALLWAIVPTLAAAAGFLRVLWPTAQTSPAPAETRARLTRSVSLLVVGAYGASILGHSFLLPFYSPLKASYALSALACLIVLIVAGLEPLARHRVGRIIAGAWLAGWVLLVYLGYWMVAA